jgi:hypothetical protein
MRDQTVLSVAFFIVAAFLSCPSVDAVTRVTDDEGDILSCLYDYLLLCTVDIEQPTDVRSNNWFERLLEGFGREISERLARTVEPNVLTRLQHDRERLAALFEVDPETELGCIIVADRLDIYYPGEAPPVRRSQRKIDAVPPEWELSKDELKRLRSRWGTFTANAQYDEALIQPKATVVFDIILVPDPAAYEQFNYRDTAHLRQRRTLFLVKEDGEWRIIRDHRSCTSAPADRHEHL